MANGSFYEVASEKCKLGTWKSEDNLQNKKNSLLYHQGFDFKTKLFYKQWLWSYYFPLI